MFVSMRGLLSLAWLAQHRLGLILVHLFPSPSQKQWLSRDNKDPSLHLLWPVEIQCHNIKYRCTKTNSTCCFNLSNCLFLKCSSFAFSFNFASCCSATLIKSYSIKKNVNPIYRCCTCKVKLQKVYYYIVAKHSNYLIHVYNDLVAKDLHVIIINFCTSSSIVQPQLSRPLCPYRLIAAVPSKWNVQITEVHLVYDYKQNLSLSRLRAGFRLHLCNWGTSIDVDCACTDDFTTCTITTMQLLKCFGNVPKDVHQGVVGAFWWFWCRVESHAQSALSIAYSSSEASNFLCGSFSPFPFLHSFHL